MDKALFFDQIFSKARVNATVILDNKGIVMEINQPFTDNFGYTETDISGKYFGLLFTPEDLARKKPETELKQVLTTGQSNDENYVVDKYGHAIWCTGESILVDDIEGRQFIIKDIVNLQAKRQLQILLTETEELLEHIFESSKEIPMMILDGSLKIERVNTAFLELFEIEKTPVSGCRLADLNHPFWNDPEVKRALSKIIVANEPIRKRDFEIDASSSRKKVVRLDSRILDSRSGTGRKIFIIIEDVSEVVYQNR
jgi:PAS domain S-box-containing protein